mmetsp:Transcript_46505/g.124307  ORF Transcript_46505/g.124307 Transcript_46505/m.124307 type:complete len:355 (-) Transcript_46505:328-1392(-)
MSCSGCSRLGFPRPLEHLPQALDAVRLLALLGGPFRLALDASGRGPGRAGAPHVRRAPSAALGRCAARRRGGRNLPQALASKHLLRLLGRPVRLVLGSGRRARGRAGAPQGRPPEALARGAAERRGGGRVPCRARSESAAALRRGQRRLPRALPVRVRRKSRRRRPGALPGRRGRRSPQHVAGVRGELVVRGDELEPRAEQLQRLLGLLPGAPALVALLHGQLLLKRPALRRPLAPVGEQRLELAGPHLRPQASPEPGARAGLEGTARRPVGLWAPARAPEGLLHQRVQEVLDRTHVLLEVLPDLGGPLASQVVHHDVDPRTAQLQAELDDELHQHGRRRLAHEVQEALLPLVD